MIFLWPEIPLKSNCHYIGDCCTVQNSHRDMTAIIFASFRSFQNNILTYMIKLQIPFANDFFIYLIVFYNIF